MFVIQVRVPVNAKNYDAIKGPWLAKSWRDTGEGPFATRAEAKRFADAEVGLPFRIVVAPTVAKTQAIADDSMTEYFTNKGIEALQFLDELGGPDSLHYVETMRALSEHCMRCAWTAAEAHLYTEQYQPQRALAMPFFKALGFEEYNNGGGNIALRRDNEADGLYSLLTMKDDCEAPMHTDEPVFIGLYSINSEGELVAHIEAATAEEARDKLARGAWVAGDVKGAN